MVQLGHSLVPRVALDGEERGPRERPADRALERVDVLVLDLLARQQLDDAPPRLIERGHDDLELVHVGDPGRHRPSAVARVRRRRAGCEPGRSRLHRLAEDGLHLKQLVVGGLALVPVVSHDPQPQGGVTEVRGVVDDGAAALDGVEVLGERLEVPRHARLERGRAHVLDVLERVDHQLAMVGPARRDRKAAVAGDDARHTVP